MCLLGFFSLTMTYSYVLIWQLANIIYIAYTRIIIRLRCSSNLRTTRNDSNKVSTHQELSALFSQLQKNRENEEGYTRFFNTTATTTTTTTTAILLLLLLLIIIIIWIIQIMIKQTIYHHYRHHRHRRHHHHGIYMALNLILMKQLKALREYSHGLKSPFLYPWAYKHYSQTHPHRSN